MNSNDIHLLATFKSQKAFDHEYGNFGSCRIKTAMAPDQDLMRTCWSCESDTKCRRTKNLNTKDTTPATHLLT